MHLGYAAAHIIDAWVIGVKADDAQKEQEAAEDEKQPKDFA